jgi:hypothetical protein
VGSASTGFSSTARRQANDILSRPPFHVGRSRPFRPLAGALHTVGHWLDDAFGPIGRWILHHVLRPTASGVHVAFGNWWPYVVGALAVGAGTLVASLLVRRRARVARDAPQRARPTQAQEDPEQLERLALEAERRAELARAVRLRFRAGLVRLERQGYIDHRDIRTTQQLKRAVPSATFGALATDIEEIVYGGRAATMDEVVAARQGWPRVTEEVGAASGTAP